MKTTLRRGDRTATEIRHVALEQFAKHGFQATTLRHIAARVGLQVGSLYNHITSKGELLFEIMEAVLLDLLADQRPAAETSDVEVRLRGLIHNHVRFHGERANEVFVGNSELRSLTRWRRRRIVTLRREYEQLFQTTLEEGVQQGAFLDMDARTVAFGIIAMATSVSIWYSRNGRLSLEQVGEIYAAMALRAICKPTSENCLRIDGDPAQVLSGVAGSLDRARRPARV